MDWEHEKIDEAWDGFLISGHFQTSPVFSNWDFFPAKGEPPTKLRWNVFHYLYIVGKRCKITISQYESPL